MAQDPSHKDMPGISARMRREWDRRIQHDYRYWMSDGVSTDDAMWEVGRRDFEFLLRGLPAARRSDQVALELGCGVGRLLRPAAGEFATVIGVDVSVEAIERAKHLLKDLFNVRLVLGNGTDIHQVQSGSVDFAYSFAALCSMPVAVVAGYLLEIGRVLAPNGVARLQIYLGSAQETFEEDTLAIRSFERSAFQAAAEAAGFLVKQVEELVLPFEISDHRAGLVAHLVTLQKLAEPVATAEEISRLLLPDGEKVAGSAWVGSSTEYLMAIARAQQLLDAGDLAGAEVALQFAVDHYRAAADDFALVEEMQAKIRAETQRVRAPMVASALVSERLSGRTEIIEPNTNDLFEKNLAAMDGRYGCLPAEMRALPATDAFTVKRNTDGLPVFELRGVSLIHEAKPQRAAESWAEQTLNTPRLREAKAILVCGAGAGYQLEALVKRTSKPIYVYEPEPALLRGLLWHRDMRDLLSRLSALTTSVSEIQKKVETEVEPGGCEIVILPQSRALAPDRVDELRRSFVASRGLQQLRPRIAVVGPMYGGSLPIARYTARALLGLKQRATGFDLSSFYQSFKNIGGFVKNQARRDLLESQYVELISRSVLEGIDERPVDILICLAQAPMSPEVLTEIRNRGIVTVMWFVEDCSRFQTWRYLAPYFDYMFVIQKGEHLQAVKDAGAGRVIYLPVGCDPDIHCPLTLGAEETERYGSDISFLGAGYNNRRHMFAYLANRNFKIWGTEWPDCMPFNQLVQDAGRRIEPEEYIKIFNASKINLNLHSSAERDGVEPFGDFVNPRTFELASAGAFQLVDERTLMPELFSIGNEMAVFHDAREMQEQIEYYLAHPAEREKVIAASRARALSEHTYQHRVKAMLEYIYADRFEQIQARAQTGVWQTTLTAAKDMPELEEKLRGAFERGDDPQLDSILPDITAGKGNLSEVEQKLLFLHHIRSQTTTIQQMRNEKAE